MANKGVVRNGVIVMANERQLPEGTEVEILVEHELLGKDLEPFVGSLKGPKDLARNHDHYLHGKPN